MIAPKIMTSAFLASVVTQVRNSASAVPQHAYGRANYSECKCIPGDECWPSPEEWARFNNTIRGKLVAPSQLASVCHDPDYDEAECANVQSRWTDPWFHDESSSSIMAAAVANQSCDPFTARETPCKPGNTISYSVNASDASDFAAAISFARTRDIRLVIRNTGHDILFGTTIADLSIPADVTVTTGSYLGKSTGRWALSVWTHHMKRTEYIPHYNSSWYSGPAIRLGAGIQVEEAYTAAHALGSLIVGGDCASVGVAGGYLQGGGHSALSSMYGLAADGVLEWEVVDGTGTLLTASPEHNTDLYWALSGGGGGTYGIVSSVVVKLHPEMPMTGVQLQFGLADGSDSEGFRRAVAKYHELIPVITAAPYHGMGIAQLTNTSFNLTPLTLPNVSAAAARELLVPLVRELDGQDGEVVMDYSLNITEHSGWLDYWRRLIEPNPTQLVQNAQYGGWMVPRSVLDADDGGALQEAVWQITDAGCVFVGLALNVTAPLPGLAVQGRNSVLASWRDAAMAVILSTPWPEDANLNDMHAKADTMTNTCVPALSKLAPDAGAYLNEADPNQPDWQTAFYGANYDRLLAIKNKYDPDHLFYGPTAVGSDFYSLDDAGRLCRTGLW